MNIIFLEIISFLIIVFLYLILAKLHNIYASLSELIKEEKEIRDELNNITEELEEIEKETIQSRDWVVSEIEKFRKLSGAMDDDERENYLFEISQKK